MIPCVVWGAWLGLTLAVAGANAAGECQWPTVGALRAGDTKCSATLIHPQVIATAAHCLADGQPGTVRFGEFFAPSAMRVEVVECTSNPDFADSQAPSDDYAVCRLAQPVEGLPATPLLIGCELDALQPGTVAVVAGFGVTESDGVFGNKRYGFTSTVSEVRSDGTIWVGDTEVGGCIGDSGGPAYVQLSDGGWRTVGLLTFAPQCGEGEGLFRTLSDRTKWIEDVTGYDVTPCHDDDHQYSGGPACAAISADPRAPQQGWSGSCVGPTVSPASTCEPTAEPTGSTGEPVGPVTPPEDATSSGADSAGAQPPESSSTGGDTGCAVGRGDDGLHLVVLLVLFAGGRRERRRTRQGVRCSEPLDERDEQDPGVRGNS